MPSSFVFILSLLLASLVVVQVYTIPVVCPSWYFLSFAGLNLHHRSHMEPQLGMGHLARWYVYYILYSLHTQFIQIGICGMATFTI